MNLLLPQENTMSPMLPAQLFVALMAGLLTYRDNPKFPFPTYFTKENTNQW